MARKEMQEAFACRIHLFLFVKVREKWKENSAFLRLHGLG
jgi:GTPase Era involved in 16S rRNA processing